MKIIRKELLIEAPVHKVWDHITDPKKIAGWLMPNDFQSRVGSAFTLECDAEGKFACTVTEIIPQRKLVYTFTSKDIKVETTVTITLTAEGKATRLILVHSGWDALPPTDQKIAEPFDAGWGVKLAVLRDQLIHQTE